MDETKFEAKDKFLHVEHKSRKLILFDNLLGGLAWGVGSVIGATVIIGLLGIIITQTRNIPLIGDVVNIAYEEFQKGRGADVFNGISD